MTSWPGIVDDGSERATVAPAADVERVLAELRRTWESPLPPITLYLTPSEAVATVLREELTARGNPARVVVAPGTVAPDEVIGVRIGRIDAG